MRIPDGATRKLNGFYYKKMSQAWLYHNGNPEFFKWESSMLQDIYIENYAIPIKQDKEMKAAVSVLIQKKASNEY